MKYSLLGIISLLLFSLLAACGRSEAPPTPAATPLQPTSQAVPLAGEASPPAPTPTVVQGTVVLWHSWDQEDLPLLVQVIDQFQEQYPNVQFDVLYIPIEDLRQRYELAVQDGTGPSILLGPGEWSPLLWDAGLVADLTATADAALLESLNPAALAAGRYKGALVGLPYAQQGVVLYRNNNIVVAAPESYEEMIELGQANTFGNEMGAYLERSFLYAGGILNGIGGQLMDESGYPAFNNVKGVEWIELLRNYDLAGPVAFQSSDDLDLFQQGRVGMLIDGTWNMGVISDTLGAENMVIDTWPYYQQGALAGFVQSDLAYLNLRGSPADQMAAWEFVRYLLSPAAQVVIASPQRIPAARATPLENKLLAQALAALNGGVGYPVVPQMAAYPAALDTALKSVFENGISPAVALQAADAAIRLLLDAQQTTTPAVTPTPAPSPGLP